MSNSLRRPFMFTTIQRTGREAPNANGFFVQNAHGATVAGPFATQAQAWTEEDRLRDLAAFDPSI